MGAPAPSSARIVWQFLSERRAMGIMKLVSRHKSFDPLRIKIGRLPRNAPAGVGQLAHEMLGRRCLGASG